MGSLKVPATAIVDCTTLFQPTLQWVPNIHTPNEEVCFCRDAWIEGLWSSLGQYGNAGCIRKSTTIERTGTTGKGKKQMIFAYLWGFAWCFGLALTPLALSSSVAHGTYFLFEGTKVTPTKYFLTDSLIKSLERDFFSVWLCGGWGEINPFPDSFVARACSLGSPGRRVQGFPVLCEGTGLRSQETVTRWQ